MPRRHALLNAFFGARHLRIEMLLVNFRLVWPETPAFGSGSWPGGVDVGMSARGLVAEGVDIRIDGLSHVNVMHSVPGGSVPECRP